MTTRVSGQHIDPTSGKPLRQRYRETSEYGGMVRRMVKAYGARVASGDIAELERLVALRADVDAHIETAARALHEGSEDHPGYSWTEIGRVLGITRQSARERFTRPPAGPPAEVTAMWAHK